MIPSTSGPGAGSDRRDSSEASAYDALPPRTWRDWLAPLLVGLAILAGALAVGWVWTGGRLGGGAMAGMAARSPGGELPAVAGFAHGESIEFVHTEASDPQVASMLTGMMGSPVLVVPALAGVPDSALADVYVFRNGVQPAGPRGPFGFQPDVFDSVPGDPTYSPLRRVLLVSWRGGSAARQLRSAGEVEAAATTGELSVERSSAVVNMPMTRWPGGAR